MLNEQYLRGEEDTSIISEALSIASAVQGEGPYFGGNICTLVNGTDGGGVSIPYPTAYYEVSQLVSYKVDGPCTRSCYVDVAYAIELGHFGNKSEVVSGCSTRDGQYQFEAPYYQAITDDRFTMPDFSVPHWQGAVDKVSFASWMAADKRLMNIAPDILSCSVLDQIDGPPAIKIPVSALTATRCVDVKHIFTSPSDVCQFTISTPILG